MVLFAMFWSTSKKFVGYHEYLIVQWWQKKSQTEKGHSEKSQEKKCIASGSQQN